MSIKSRKLFAILVITAMVLALLPVTAFAASVDYSAAASYMTVDKTSVAVGKDATFTLIVRDSSGAAVTGKTIEVFFKSSRDAEQVTVGSVTTGGSILYNGVKLNVTTNEYGRATFTLTSSIAGEVTLTLKKDAADDTGIVIDSKKITFTTTAADVSQVILSADNTIRSAGQEVKLTAYAYDNKLNGVEGQTVTFYKKRGTGSFVSIGTATTDNLGKADLKVTETVADIYTFKARVAGVDSSQISVTYNPGSPVSIEAVTADGAIDLTQQTVKFAIKDSFGNKTATAAHLTVTLTAVPDDSALQKNNESVFEKSVDSDNNVTAKFTPDVAGTYKVKGAITGTGISKTITLEAKKLGEIQSITLGFKKDDPTYLVNYKEDELTLDVKVVDVNGIKKTAATTEVILSSSDPTLVSIDGHKIKGPNNKDKFGEVTITATHLEKGYTATLVVPVVGKPASITSTVEVDDLKADVTLQAVDKDGRVTVFVDSNNEPVEQDYTIFAGQLTVTAKKLFSAVSGKATFTLEAAEYGSYPVTVVTANGFAKTFTVNFKAPAPPKPGAQSVLMFIGSRSYVADGAAGTMDVAPFIENGRTFVPVRFIGEAFGAELDWTPKDAATEKVFITRDDIQVTITIGSYVIEVVRDGVAETVTSDVAAFIKDGRTFLPLRVIGEIFGAEFDWGPKDAATEWVSFTQ